MMNICKATDELAIQRKKCNKAQTAFESEFCAMAILYPGPLVLSDARFHVGAGQEKGSLGPLQV